MARKKLDIKTKLMGRGLVVSTMKLEDETSFETVVLHRANGGLTLEQMRYKTEKQAISGHQNAVAKWKTVPRKNIKELVEETKRQLGL